MADNSNQSHPTKQEFRLPAWAKGLIFGEIFWGLLIFGIFYLQGIEENIPDWFGRLERGTLSVTCGFCAFPILVGGNLFIWKDGSQPTYWWLENLAFHVSFGLVLYGLLGAIIGRWIEKGRKSSGS